MTADADIWQQDLYYVSWRQVVSRRKACCLVCRCPGGPDDTAGCPAPPLTHIRHEGFQVLLTPSSAPVLTVLKTCAAPSSWLLARGSRDSAIEVTRAGVGSGHRGLPPVVAQGLVHLIAGGAGSSATWGGS